MASSENQGLQAGLIISVILVIALGVTTYLFYSQADGAQTALDARTKEVSELNTKMTTQQTELNDLKKIAGFQDTDGIDKIKLDFAKTVEPLLAGRQPDAVNLATLVTELQTTNLEQVQRYNELQTENNNLKTTNEQREAAKQAQIDEITKARDDAIAEAKAATEKFNVTQAASAKTESELKTQVDTLQKDLVKTKADADARVATLEEQLKNLQAIVADRTRRIEDMKNESFELPFGEITLVNQRNKTVWINLGEDDKLRRQVVFAVYPTDENAVGNDLARKATIEVTQILGPHLAEARIRDDDFTNPIIPGDKVHTALWAPGEKIHVALAGVMDIDGDDSSDIELLRNLITAGGAVIDAEVDGRGNVQGAITPQTGYLIIGNEPPQREGNEAALEPYTKLRREAIQYGLKTISLEQFLKRSGWKDIRQVLNYTRPGTAQEFLKGKEEGKPVSNGRTSALFRERQPKPKAAEETEEAPAQP